MCVIRSMVYGELLPIIARFKVKVSIIDSILNEENIIVYYCVLRTVINSPRTSSNLLNMNTQITCTVSHNKNYPNHVFLHLHLREKGKIEFHCQSSKRFQRKARGLGDIFSESTKLYSHNQVLVVLALFVQRLISKHHYTATHM